MDAIAKMSNLELDKVIKSKQKTLESYKQKVQSLKDEIAVLEKLKIANDAIKSKEEPVPFL